MTSRICHCIPWQVISYRGNKGNVDSSLWYIYRARKSIEIPDLERVSNHAKFKTIQRKIKIGKISMTSDKCKLAGWQFSFGWKVMNSFYVVHKYVMGKIFKERFSCGLEDTSEIIFFFVIYQWRNYKSWCIITIFKCW